MIYLLSLPSTTVIICFGSYFSIETYETEVIYLQQTLLSQTSISSSTKKKISYNFSESLLISSFLLRPAKTVNLSLPMLEHHLVVKECSSKLLMEAILVVFRVGMYPTDYYNCFISVEKKLKPKQEKELAKQFMLNQLSFFFFVFCSEVVYLLQFLMQ